MVSCISSLDLLEEHEHVRSSKQLVALDPFLWREVPTAATLYLGEPSAGSLSGSGDAWLMSLL